MSRLTPITGVDASDEQREVRDAVIATRGPQMVGPDGALVGPFNAMIVSPRIGRRFADLGAAVRHESSLPDDLLELAICTTGAHWRSEFEWWAHRRLGLEAGLDPEALDAIAAGDTPELASPSQRAVHELTTELLVTTRVSDSTWAAAAAHLDEVQLVDLVTTVGYYCLISSVLNTFEVPLPDGVASRWEG